MAKTIKKAIKADRKPKGPKSAKDKEIALLRNNLTIVWTELTEVKKLNTSLGAEVTKLEEDKSVLSQQITCLESTVSALSADLSETMKELQTQRSRADTLYTTAHAFENLSRSLSEDKKALVMALKIVAGGK